MIKKVFVLNLVILLSSQIFSQEKQSTIIKNKQDIYSTNYNSISIAYQNGYVFPTNEFVKGANAEKDTISDFQTFAFKYTKQTLGKQLWHQLYNYPEYGFGAYIASFHNPEEIGLPIAVYGYYTAPFHRWKKFVLNYEFGFGIAFNWKNYSPSNVYNIAIGAKYTTYIDLGIKTEYQISNKILLDFGFSLTHFSNGRLKEPNFGLNTIAPKLGVKYNFNNRPIPFIKQEVPKYQANNEWYISAFIASKNIIYDSLNIPASEKFEGESYPVFGISAVFNRQIAYKSKIGIGIATSYDGSVNPQLAVDNGELDVKYGPFLDNIQISIFPSYELVVNKVSLLIQPSFYIYRKKLKNQSPVFYQRIGLKYNFYKNLYIGLNLRAYQYHISDFIEWNIAYRIK